MADGNHFARPQGSIVVNEFTNSVLDPDQPMLGPIADGGTIIANTAPGCWGPMITPRLRGGHEVTRPVHVDGAMPGDALIVHIRDVTVTSMATSSGHDSSPEGFCLGDPYVAARCPTCDEVWPETHVEGIGPKAVKCDKCGNAVTPFEIVHGYTVGFDPTGSVGLTLPTAAADAIAGNAAHFASLPTNSRQHPILTYAPSDMAGVMVRMRPFMGQLGTCPSIAMPDSHNAGDFGAFLEGAPHEYGLTQEQIAQHKTDGHMDIDAVRAGSVLVCPVKVPGGGIYMGDMHAAQGDGEIAGHTMDVSGSVTLQVEVLKDWPIDGPVLFPLPDDLPPLARPFTRDEIAKAERLAAKYGVSKIEPSAPISVIGTAANMNAAIENGLERAARLLDLSVAEIRNRATINGAIEIGRAPGVIQVTFLAPLSRLDAVGLGDIARDQYGL
ncbi:acetamidase/formamidase family protein [Paracoccus sp. 1_MG-2023]|uniref:acetamidase/formamidase family protein n=1 Tax=unclassified Paracoccus (in: a-proteobacteria) TaxID=2688777 RepID=UPI001C095904|nr:MULTISPECIES: acetamidase/formamidase family protein [unclassified Paracoccus (in: a-proteobacteria)]MBU2957975.1 acetamidase/formamidase family protein [Paracoccus sp. C2R09]MDO6668831.1 acetamidase/formamidase family protein [Paracoccus sp. 1_MG-2023]